MDFVNRLRSDHLRSFWYFPTKVNFALVATFGSLLLATAPCQEEVEFYRARLGEYKWTLSVSAKNAGFLNFAIESLESSTDLLKSLPVKPKMEDLDLRQIPPSLPPAPTKLPQLISPSEEEGDQEDDDMMDEVDTTTVGGALHTPAQSLYNTIPLTNDNHYTNYNNNNNNITMIHSSNFDSGFNFRMMSPVTESTEMSGGGMMLPQNGGEFYGGPFSGTAFEGLEARDWFDNSHHGSPEAERMGLLS